MNQRFTFLRYTLRTAGACLKARAANRNQSLIIKSYFSAICSSQLCYNHNRIGTKNSESGNLLRTPIALIHVPVIAQPRRCSRVFRPDDQCTGHLQKETSLKETARIALT